MARSGRLVPLPRKRFSVPRALGGTAVALALALPAPALANTINVTSHTDEVTGGNGCSLREAVIAANEDSTGAGGDCLSGSGDDVINVPGGSTPYTLAIPGPSEGASQTGDLDLTADVTIAGVGPGAATIDGGALDRVFHNMNGVTST